MSASRLPKTAATFGCVGGESFAGWLCESALVGEKKYEKIKIKAKYEYCNTVNTNGGTEEPVGVTKKKKYAEGSLTCKNHALVRPPRLVEMKLSDPAYVAGGSAGTSPHATNAIKHGTTRQELARAGGEVTMSKARPKHHHLFFIMHTSYLYNTYGAFPQVRYNFYTLQSRGVPVHKCTYTAHSCHVTKYMYEYPYLYRIYTRILVELRAPFPRRPRGALTSQRFAQSY